MFRYYLISYVEPVDVKEKRIPRSIVVTAIELGNVYFDFQEWATCCNYNNMMESFEQHVWMFLVYVFSTFSLDNSFVSSCTKTTTLEKFDSIVKVHLSKVHMNMTLRIVTLVRRIYDVPLLERSFEWGRKIGRVDDSIPVPCATGFVSFASVYDAAVVQASFR